MATVPPTWATISPGEFSTAGGSADSVNNYEAVFLPAGTADSITMTVRATNIAGDGVPNTGDGTDQDFALTCYNCIQSPTFSMSLPTTQVALCQPDDAVYDVSIGSILGFSDPVSLTTVGEPVGTTVTFSQNPVTPTTPPTDLMMTVGNTAAAAAGSYSISITGTAGVEIKNRDVGLDIFAASPNGPGLTSPADMATLVDLQPTFEWVAESNAQSYLVEVSDDPGFGTILLSTTVNTPANTAVFSAELPSNTELYWRVTANNACGGNLSAVQSFTTVPLPGDCQLGASPMMVQDYTFEADAEGWTSGSNQGADTWALSTANPQAGGSTQHWHVDDQSTTSDTFLTSPVVTLPTGASPLTFQFWNMQQLEDRTGGGCWDAGILEIAVDGGPFQQVDNSLLLTDPYDGEINAGPLDGSQGWCGDPQPYLNSIVDIDAMAGSDVQFRFRLSTDGSVGRPGWDIDEIQIQGCEMPDTGLIFEDGFEN